MNIKIFIYKIAADKLVYILSDISTMDLKLICAIKKDDLVSVKKCIENGADIFSSEHYPIIYYPLLLSCEMNRKNITKYLLKQKIGFNTAIFYDKTDKNPKYYTTIGFEFIKAAITSGNIDIVKLLIKAGVDKNDCLRDGIRISNVAIIEILLQFDVTVTIQNLWHNRRR